MSTYNTIINRAIAGFNDIYSVLAAKGIKRLNDAKTETISDALTNSMTIPIEEYAGMISSELYRVGDRLAADMSQKLVNGVIRDYGTSAITQTQGVSASYTESSGTYTYTLTGTLGVGFYDGNTINLAYSGSNISLDSTTSTNLYNSTKGKYFIAPAANTVLGSVSVNKGSISIDIDNLTKTESVSTSIELPSNDLLAGTSLVAPANSSDAVGLSIKSIATVTGSVLATIDATTGFTEGYIKSADVSTSTDSIDINDSANTITTVYIDKGTISGGEITSGTVSIAPGTGSNITVYSTANKPVSGTFFEVVGSASGINATIDTTTGYITGESDKTVVSNGSLQDVSFYIPKGSASVSTSITTQLVDRSDDKTGISGGDNIFLSSAPATGDYYTIQSSASTTVGAGYLNTTDTDSATSSTYYIPKAILNYTTVGENNDPVLEVSSAGYLPSGILSDITEITGNITYANVDATLSSSSVSLTNNSTNGYALSISKASTTSPGFITGTSGQGSVSLTGNTYVQKSALTSALGVPSFSTGTITKSGSNYNIGITGSITNTTTIDEGYIHLNDISGFTGANYSVSTSNNTESIVETKSFSGNTLSVPAAAVTVTSNQASVSVTTSQVTYTETAPSAGNSSNYAAITIQGSNGSLAIDNNNTSFGYLGNNNEITLSGGNSQSKTLYVPTLDGVYGTTTGPASGTTDDNGNTVESLTPNNVYQAGTIGSLTGNISESDSEAHASDNASSTTGLRNVLYVDTSGKYARYDTKVTLSAYAMGSEIVSALAALESRLNGTISAS